MDPWIVEPGSDVDLEAVDPASTPDAPGDKAATRAAEKDLRKNLAELQVRVRAESKRSLLVVLQGMDCSGKDGVIRRVFRSVDPQGVRIKAFRKPSEEELAHDFLWRVHTALPVAGEIGIFNRSHYEDVIVKRAREEAQPDEWEPRIPSIVDFERHLTRNGTTLVKLFLHISADEQTERLRARLEKPHKRWKYDPSDAEDQQRWPLFQTAYQETIACTSTVHAPWRIVPADRKWYRDWAVLTVLVSVLQELDPQYPRPPVP